MEEERVREEKNGGRESERGGEWRQRAEGEREWTVD